MGYSQETDKKKRKLKQKQLNRKHSLNLKGMQRTLGFQLCVKTTSLVVRNTSRGLVSTYRLGAIRTTDGLEACILGHSANEILGRENHLVKTH